jgi:hypothetical protein
VYDSTILAALDSWASVSGIVGGAAALFGVPLIVIQLRQAALAARAQATIQFQDAFRRSSEARGALQATFPLHTSVLTSLAKDDADRARLAAQFGEWNDSMPLTDEQERHARQVINALNDVAQYVADGLSMKSALQQYHSIFVRVGVLLYPLIELDNCLPGDVTGINRDDANREKPTRRGIRILELMNGGLRYHRFHPKHAGRELKLTRDAGKAVLVLIPQDNPNKGLQERPNHMPTSWWDKWSSQAIRERLDLQIPISARIRTTERNLRR